MYRHVRQSCKIANSDEGMEKLLDHTLRQQNASLIAKVDRLTTLVEQLAPGAGGAIIKAAPAAAAPPHPPQPLAPPPLAVAQHAHQITNNITIHAWDAPTCIQVALPHILAAFADNARLREWASLAYPATHDPHIAPPYVTELLMDLTKRAHSDPAARNVYLNPRRSDQVLVHKKSGAWEVAGLAEATRQIFDGVAATIHHTVLTPAELARLPIEAQNALATAGLLYDEEPDEYARRGKAPMSAHLSNTAPPPRAPPQPPCAPNICAPHTAARPC
jgi:hypothetical protein